MATATANITVLRQRAEMTSTVAARAYDRLRDCWKRNASEQETNEAAAAHQYAMARDAAAFAAWEAANDPR
jgi:hypothetical protein